MDSEQIKKAGKQIRRMGWKVFGKSLFIAFCTTAVLVIVMGSVGTMGFEELLALGEVFGLLFLITQLKGFVFAAKMFRSGAYISKHSMECYKIKAQRYSRSLVSYLELGRIHWKDKAEFVLDGKKYHTYIYYMLREGRNNDSLLVFRDTEAPKKVFAVPAVYIKDISV